MLRMSNSSTRDKRNQPTQEKIILRIMRQFEKKYLAAEPAFFDFLRQMVREVQPMLRMPNSSTRDKRN